MNSTQHPLRDSSLAYIASILEQEQETSESVFAMPLDVVPIDDVVDFLATCYEVPGTSHISPDITACVPIGADPALDQAYHRAAGVQQRRNELAGVARQIANSWEQAGFPHRLSVAHEQYSFEFFIRVGHTGQGICDWSVTTAAGAIDHGLDCDDVMWAISAAGRAIERYIVRLATGVAEQQPPF
jgi:hypothetical protein